MEGGNPADMEQREEAGTMGRPVRHFEIGVRDLAKATAFYEELFGWKVDEEQMPGYRLVHTAGEGVDGGLLELRDGMPPYVTIYVGVDDVRGSLVHAEDLGAKVIVEPMPVPGVGEFGMIQDPDGAMIGVFEEQGV
jgi:predicted enzyme related to lactoylglutathione lyase